MSIWILALLDDVSVLLDDAATMTKVSMQKTAGILWDDLAVNAEQASGFSASRELPILWRITKAALLNKIIILPFAFLLSYFAPDWVIPSILVFGGCYLAFEGTEKIHEFLEYKILHKKHDISQGDIVMNEDEKVKSAIFTDFILSIEIIILALSTVLDESLSIQIIVVSIVALAATFWVYGVVTFLVRLDDMGIFLMRKSSTWKLQYRFWSFLVSSLPIIVKILWVVWTWAMLLVAGWIFTHNIWFIHHFYEQLHFVPSIIFDTILWFFVGYILVGIFFIGRRMIKSGVKMSKN